MFVEYLTKPNGSIDQFINELMTKLGANVLTSLVSISRTSKFVFSNRKTSRSNVEQEKLVHQKCTTVSKSYNYFLRWGGGRG